MAREFGAWCRDPSYIIGKAGVSREGFLRLRAHVLAYSIADDNSAPKRAVDALLDLFSNARIEPRCVKPQDVGLAKLGRFGFFRREVSNSLWLATVKWLSER